MFRYLLTPAFSVLLYLLVFSSMAATAQEDMPLFRHLTVEDGLSNNWIKAILKDQDGFMWFGTFNGLNRFDGSNFKLFQASETCRLSDNIIESLAEDAHGNIWVGTFSGGLNRFDRKTEQFTPYLHDPNHPSSISGNRVSSILIDKNGNLWIGTDAGLDLYDYAKQTFTHYLHNTEDSKSITLGLVSSLHQDKNGRMWVGTEGGLNLYNPEEGNFTRYNHRADVPNSLSEDYVKSIYEDKYGTLWLGTWGGGLDKFIPTSGTFHHYTNQQTGSGLSNDAVLCVAGDHENQIFVATEGGGLNVFDIQHETFHSFQPDITNARSINSNSVHTLYFDDASGMLWAGTYNGGINYFSKWDKPFKLYQAKIYGLNNNHVNCITEDQDENLWIGTDGGGINVLDKKTAAFTYFLEKDDKKNGLQSNAILSVLCDKQNRIWVGSYEGGLDVIGNNRKSILHFTHIEGDPSTLSDRNVSAIYEDRRGNIWIGTMFGGLNLYNAKTNTFRQYKHDPANEKSLIDNFIYGIFEDRHGQLLVQTGKGLEIFDSKTGNFKRFEHSLSYNIGVPGSLLEDSQGNLWVGSQEHGLFRVDRTGVKVNTYTIKDGLPSNSIAGMLEDEFGSLWISTQRGLCKFEEAIINPEKVKFHIYATEDGLQGSEFKRGAYCKRKNGQMVFGGQNGFNVFDPLKIKYNPFVPPVKVTGFKIFNKEVDFTQNKILNAPISVTHEIHLRHDHTVFTFEFAALNYMLAEKNQYAYMMESFEETWNYVGSQHSATYSNLDPGEYYFSVKAANNDGVWNDDITKIKITIVPPWWDNTYFKLGLILLLIGGVFTYFKLKNYQLKRSKKALEHQVALSTADLKDANKIIEERQKEILEQNETLVLKNKELEIQTFEIKNLAEEIQEMTEAKFKFFSNISHELHTPLNLMLAQLEDLLNLHNHDSDRLSEKHSSIYRNATRLNKLINQLLDWGADVPDSLKEDDMSSYEVKFNEELEDLKLHRLQTPFILVIESEIEVNAIKYKKLKSHYHFEFASGREEGFRMATEDLPDLILCDGLLADMDGTELCKMLKSDQRSSHIPIILMTARAGEDHHGQDLAMVADDLITKPFQNDLLELKIKNIFFTRQKLKEMFLKGTITPSDTLNLNSFDEQFLRKAVTVVRDNLKNSDFGVDELSEYFGMSRRNVLRKMKGITGLSINEYIRSTRLKEAYNMLMQGELNVSEVAYSVGFTDPKYFSNCFKKLYGKLPSEVRAVSNTP